MRNHIIFVLCFAIVGLLAQVGINNDDPEQALDVNGKVKVGDDNVPPSEGTLRFNEQNDEFEGYDGAQWKNLSDKSAGSLPSGPIPIYGNEILLTNGAVGNIRFGYWDSFSTFEKIPDGKYLLITGIYTSPNAATLDATYYGRIGATMTSEGYPSPSGAGLTFTSASPHHISGDAAPLVVGRPGGYITAYQTSNLSGRTNTDIEVRGFLVDDLNYD
ncbi:MAG: hypothetical protein Q7Q71_11770 [Verrucomicrobiota bacterium JB023]|nr:hypothetical protein [Verrucomicrobiota bacterium JB023]